MPRRAPKCKMTCLRPETFDLADQDNWLAHLHREGFVVIHEAISQEDADFSMETFKQELSYVSPRFDWENTETWTPDNTPMVWNKSSVMFNGFGHSDSNWHMRLNSCARHAFSAIYETTDLVTSFDGISLFLSEKQRSTSWLHQDQRPEDYRLSVQAILNILPCDEFDAGFVCVPRSHTEYVPPMAQSKSDWMMLPKDDPNQKRACKILTPPRSLILFNSKTIHANTGMVTNHPRGLHVNRFSAYTTFVPRSRQTIEVLSQRMRGYHQGISCSHWADRFETKKIPFHVRGKYLSRGFRDLVPRTEDGNIPADRVIYV